MRVLAAADVVSELDCDELLHGGGVCGYSRANRDEVANLALNAIAQRERGEPLLAAGETERRERACARGYALRYVDRQLCVGPPDDHVGILGRARALEAVVPKQARHLPGDHAALDAVDQQTI